MATWDFMGYAVFRPGYLDDYDMGTAVFTAENNVFVPVYEVPDFYITNPEDVDTDEITAAWPSLSPVDIDQEIITMISGDDTGQAGHRIYLWGDGTGRGNTKGETAYETARFLFMPASFVIGCGAGGAGYMPFVYHNGHGEVWLLGPIDQGAIPKNVYIRTSTSGGGTGGDTGGDTPDDTPAYDKMLFLSGLGMGLCSRGDPSFSAAGGEFLSGYLAGCELKRGR